MATAARDEPLLAETPATSDDAPSIPQRSPAIACSILRLAWPVFLSQLVMWSQSFFTLWLLGQVGDKLSMAAFGLANVVCNVTGHCFLWGIGAGLDTLASQAWGAKEFKAIGLYVQRVVLILTFLVNVPVVAIWLNATPLLIALKQDARVADKVAAYARLRIPGLFAQGPMCVLSKTLSSMGKTRVLAALNILGVGCSVGLSWLFISNNSPVVHWLDAKGLSIGPVAGSAIAASIVDALSAFILLIAFVCDSECRQCWPGWSMRCLYGWKSYLKLAIPAMLMGIFEWMSWDIVSFLAGLCHTPHTAQTSLATNALLGQIISLAYCVPLGLQTGVQTLVGNALGAQSPIGAKLVARVGSILGVLVMVIQAVALVVLRKQWALLFTAEPQVGSYVAELLPWVVFFNAGDGVQLCLSGVITGAGKQHVTTPVLCVSYWILGLPLGAVAAFYYPRNGLLGLWWGMTLAVWLHVFSYLLICFARPCLRFAIDWKQAAKVAAERLAEPAADAAAAINSVEPIVVAPVG